MTTKNGSSPDYPERSTTSATDSGFTTDPAPVSVRIFKYRYSNQPAQNAVLLGDNQIIYQNVFSVLIRMSTTDYTLKAELVRITGGEKLIGTISGTGRAREAQFDISSMTAQEEGHLYVYLHEADVVKAVDERIIIRG